MKSLLLIFTPLVLYAGQSLQVSTTNASAAMTGRAHNLPTRVEFYLHDWNANPTTNTLITSSAATGFAASLLNNSGQVLLLLLNTFESGAVSNGGLCLVPIDTLPTKGVYVRYQHDPSTKTDTCEMWDINGNRFHNSNWIYATDLGVVGTGIQVGGTWGENRGIAFLRVLSNLIPLNSRMPVTADTSSTKLLEWKFDGNLSDSSGNGWTASMSSGSSTFVSTPNQNIIAVVRTANAPAWSNWTSLRAGFPAQLDGTASFSQADASASVTCFWQSLAGPSTLTWSNRQSCTPTIKGLVFGSYNIAIVVTDIAGLTATTALQVGAVATDSNGVVVNSDPNADLIYGPMIAFGKNPWQYQDERALYATTARSAYYTSIGLDPPPWGQALPGTISFPFVPLATTLCGAVASATTLSLTVCTVEKLDLTSFPTHVLLGGFGGEEILVTGTTGTSGTQTLTVAYDGRGYRTGTYLHTAAQPWSNGASVTQQKVTGSGTSFLATFNPAGSGVQGKLAYNAGTVTATAGSNVITGAGTSWTTQNICFGGIALCGLTIRISGTHSGTPFTFFAAVNTLNSGTQVTLNRPFPPDADTASGLTYAFILAPSDGSGRNLVLHYARTDNGAYPYDGAVYYLTSACETDTACYLFSYFDAGSFNPTTSTCLGFTGMECGRHVAYIDSIGYVGDNYGVNFYDEGLAHYALYKRSGWTPALDAFRKIEGTDVGGDPARLGWLFYPEMSQGDTNPQARRASITGAVVAAVLDGKTSNWPALRKFANNGISPITNPFGCNNDVREGIAYPLSWLTLAALFDPDSTQRANWTTHLGDAYTFDAGCAGTGTPLQTNSWQSGFTWNNNMTPPLAATNGSAVLTASTPIDPRICPMVATGTDAVVTNGSDVVTSPGSHFVNSPGKIMFFGDAINPLLTFDFIFDNAGQIHLSGMYPGATAGNVHWQIDFASTYAFLNPDAGMSLGVSNNDPQLSYNWTCVLSNGGLTMTLDRPWNGPNNTGVAINTTIASNIATGLHTVTPASMAGIVNGGILNVQNSNFTHFETVAVSNVTATTFDATFTSTKTGPNIFLTMNGVFAWHASLGGVGITGKGQQPFILGIKTLQMAYGAKMPGALGANYNTLATNAATWIKNYGVDPVSGGLYYARIFQQCEPVFADSTQPVNFPFATRNPQCSFNGSNGSNQAKAIARALVGEAQNAARVSFESDNSSANKAVWDSVYNNQWGAVGLTDPAFYTDGITTSNIDDGSLSGGKWTGFFFGIGMSHQWPAVRLGGVAPAVNRNLYIAFNLSTIPAAASFRILLTAPSGKTSTVVCPSSPCIVPADARQGVHLMTLQYLGASSNVLAQSSQPIPVVVE